MKNHRGNLILLARIVFCLGLFTFAQAALALDQRFYSLNSGSNSGSSLTPRGSNFLVLRPGDRGNTANTTTLRPHGARPAGAATAPVTFISEKPNPPTGTFYSLKRYQPRQRQTYTLNTGRPELQLPERAPSKSPELSSTAPYSNSFYGAAYAGGTEQSWPVAVSAQQRISSGFGMRSHPVTGRHAFHKGVDIAAATGSPVLASADGIVAETGQDRLIGKFVKLHHRDGSQSLYGHLSAVGVKEGEWLKRQEELGKVGSTGRTTGPHLHYALNVNDQAVNPMEYLTPPNRELASR